MRFSVFTHVEHFLHQDRILGYTPYIREMNIWLKNVRQVEILGPVKNKTSSIETAYEHQCLRFIKTPRINILSLKKIFITIFYFPSIVCKIYGSMRRSDHIHLRCPGNIGLIGCIIQMLFPRKAKTAKYAGNWDPNSKQPWSYNLQKCILSNTFLTRNIQVLVYGEWPKQTKNILPFFTASFSETEKVLYNKNFTSPFKFIFVGSLTAGKRPLLAIKLIEGLMGKGIPVELEIYGSGVLKNELLEYITTKNLDPFVSLMGNFKLEELKEVYKYSHFIILASQSEGWPKAVAEAMFFGCVPITTPVSCVPWMLGATPPDNYQDRKRGAEIPLIPEGRVKKNTFAKRGILISSPEWSGEDSQDLIDNTTEKITELIKNPEEMRRMSFAGQEWSQEYTLERFEQAIKEVLAPSLRKGE